MTPREIRCHKIFRAMNKTWLWNIKSSHLSPSPSPLPHLFVSYHRPVFLCQGKGMSCKANDLVWLKTQGNEQVTPESHWLMGNKPCHWNVSRMQQLRCVFMWQRWSATQPRPEERIYSESIPEMCSKLRCKIPRHTNVPSTRMLHVCVKHGHYLQYIN